MPTDSLRKKTGYDTMEELVEKTRGPRARLIDAILFHKGAASSKRIREHGNIPSGQYHFNKLEEQGIIERRGTAYESKGGSAIRYGLTQFGADVADALDVDGEPDPSQWDQVRDMANQMAGAVDNHTETLREQEQKIRALTEQLQTLEGELDELKGDGDDENVPPEHDGPDPEPELEEPEKTEQPEQPDEPEQREIPDDAPRWVKEAYNDDGTIRD